jgi:5-methyltetrahydrofolate--homocysteine methyltransferase
MLKNLGDGKPLVSDGAMGSLLIERGLKAGTCPESMNLEKPEVLEEIAAAYLEAGADILHTNTFGGSGVKLASYSLDGKVKAINEIAVAAARKVAGDQAIVSASCGPTGKMLKPYGDADPETLSETFRRQLEIAIGAGVDAVTVETMTDLTEATLAVRAAKSVSPSTPVMATMTFDSTPRGFFTIMGVSIEQAARGLEEAGADVIGSNCGNGIEKMVAIAAELAKVSSLPILIQANAGLPELRDDVVVYPESPEFMAEKSRALVDLGVAIIGGCCGTTPEHTRVMRRMVDGEA